MQRGIVVIVRDPARFILMTGDFSPGVVTPVRGRAVGVRQAEQMAGGVYS